MTLARNAILALPILVALLLTGCGGMVQTYDGPKRASSETATLKTNVGEMTFDTVWVDQVDERVLVRAYSELEVTPGRHVLRVQLSSGMLKASTRVSFEARAGHVYRVKGAMRRSGSVAWIEDERTGEVVGGDKS